MGCVAKKWVGRPTDKLGKLEEPEIIYRLFQVDSTSKKSFTVQRESKRLFCSDGKLCYCKCTVLKNS